MSPGMEQRGLHRIDDGTHREVASMLARGEHRYTAGRRRLIEVLAEAGRPLTLPEVLDADPDLPQSSVYRNLDLLERSGVIIRLITGSEHAHFELAESLLGHHHHLICVGCGTVEDIALDDDVEAIVDTALVDAARALDFEPLHHSLDLRGHCTDCR